MAAGGEVPVPFLSLADLVRRIALAAVATLTSLLPASSRVVVAGAPPPLCGVAHALVIVAVVFALVIPPPPRCRGQQSLTGQQQWVSVSGSISREAEGGGDVR